MYIELTLSTVILLAVINPGKKHLPVISRDVVLTFNNVHIT